MNGSVAFAVTLSFVALACAQTEAPGVSKDEQIARMYDEYRADFPDVPEMTVAEYLAKEDAEDVVLVDVREPEEQAVSMIPGALTKEEFEFRKQEYKDDTVITYCTIGYRSGVYAQELREAGFNALNLKGSVLSWAHAGQPFQTPAGEDTNRVHVYGKAWNLLPPGYEPVW